MRAASMMMVKQMITWCWFVQRSAQKEFCHRVYV